MLDLFYKVNIHYTRAYEVAMQSKRKRHPITLLEIMIVILLIGIIGGVLSYNLKGSLERGKKFRTDEGVKRLADILELEIERGASLAQMIGPANSPYVKDRVLSSGLISTTNVDEFLKDGWKEPYIISEKDGSLHVYSYKLDQIKQNEK